MNQLVIYPENKVTAVEKTGQASSTYIEQKCHMFSHTASYRTTLSQLQAAVIINPKRLIQDMAKNINSKPIPSRVVKKSLDTVLSVLGMSLTNTIFEDMWRSGIVFSRNKYYSIDQIYNYFEHRLGKHAADLLIKQLRKELTKL